MNYGKPNATGRSSGEFTAKEKKRFGPKCLKGLPWQWVPIELLASPAWRSMSVNCRKLMDFLIIEHNNHAGLENGHLMATYNQLTTYGLTRRKIREAIDQAKFLGLIRHEPRGLWKGQNCLSVYTLTFYPDHEGTAPTNEWKGKSEEYIKGWKDGRSETQKRVNRREIEKQKSQFTSDTKVVPLRELSQLNCGKGKS